MTFKLDKDRAFIDRMTLHAKENNNYIDVGLRQAYILPTIRGVYYIITLIIMFIWSINFDLSLGYFITFSSLTFALIIALLNVQNISKLRITPIENADFFADQFAYFSLQVTSTDRCEKINLFARRNGLFSQPISFDRNTHGIIQVPLNQPSRGVHRLNHVRFNSDYPIGIFDSWCWVHFDQPLIIYPKPLGDLPLPFAPKVRGNQETSTEHQGNEDFVNIREYQAGDPIRQIAWRKTKNTQLYIKQFSDHASKQCSLQFNHPSIIDLDTEQKLSQLCQWVIEASQKGLVYDLVLPDQTISKDSGLTHKKKCLRALACY